MRESLKHLRQAGIAPETWPKGYAEGDPPPALAFDRLTGYNDRLSTAPATGARPRFP
jgi:hypothetical protein